MQQCITCKIMLPDDSLARTAACDNRRKKCENCISEARRVRARKWRLKNADKIKESKKKWAAENKEKIAARHKEWVKANRQTCRDRVNKWNKNNREAQRKYYRQTKSRYPEIFTARDARRKAAVLRAIPSWANHSLIRNIYKEAAKSGNHVDHIVPLISGLVCGLHWEANLRVLKPIDNILKSNKYWPDMP